MRIAQFIGRFPVVSETFILRQVTSLLDLGHEVDVYADTGDDSSAAVHPDLARYRLRERTTYMKMAPETCPYEMPVFPITGETWPTGASTSIPNSKRVARAFPVFLRSLVRAPRLTIHVLNSSNYGYQAKSLSSLYRLAGVAGQHRCYDILHAHYGPVGNSYRFVKKLFQSPFIVSYYGYDCWAVPRKEGRDVYRRLFGAADCVLILADEMGKELQRLGCPAERQRKLAVGVRVKEVEFQERKPQAGEPVRLLTIARFVEKKGIEYSLRAFAEVQKTHVSIKYDIVGDGPMRKAIEKIIKELGLETSVVLHGFCEGEKLQKIMKAAHILVLSSVTAADGDQECTPVSLMDAQAAGMPVLSTQHSGIPEVIRDGHSGFLVPERNVAALAERMAFLLDHPERWPEMGRAGRQHVEENYDSEKLSHELVNIYRSVIQQTT